MTQTLLRPGTPGRALTVLTPWGRETYQIWVDQCPPGWVARIVTLPDRLWAAPGGREVLKFFGQEAGDAESAAMRFIEEECTRTNRRLAASPLVNDYGVPLGETAERRWSERIVPPTSLSEPAPRASRRLLVRFGTQLPQRPALTGNISETGLFIITDRPIAPGAAVQIDLRFPEGPVLLDARSVWVRDKQEQNLSVGFGVRLRTSPHDYIERVRTLRDSATWP